MFLDTFDLVTVKMRGIVRLTRWKEYVPFVIPLTAFGAVMAARMHGVMLDWRLGVTLLANICAVGYAFMINDIEDAADDAREAQRAARNPVASGELTPSQGWAASLAVALITLMLYALVGLWPFIIGSLTLALAHFYSWKPVRLKAWPVTDILSHSLMLSGLLFLAGYFAYGTNPGLVWIVALAATLFSVYGQLYNQLRDYEMDKAAGLSNTTIVVGKRNARYVMYSSVALALVFLVYAVYMQMIPLWIVGLVVIGAAIISFVRTPTDMRGGEAVEFSGNMQMHLLIIANIAIAAWLIAAMLHMA
ncbi:MAG TPA: prenyltransferase [Aggregatilineales bacterium]|nr:prenyltransferase [Aggregatilineales bacterium]